MSDPEPGGTSRDQILLKRDGFEGHPGLHIKVKFYKPFSGFKVRPFPKEWVPVYFQHSYTTILASISKTRDYKTSGFNDVGHSHFHADLGSSPQHSNSPLLLTAFLLLLATFVPQKDCLFLR